MGKRKVFFERLTVGGELDMRGGLKATKVSAPHKGKQQRRGAMGAWS